MTTETKPLAKSLHTVTVLVRVALHLSEEGMSGPDYSSADRVGEAARILGLTGKPDTYGLAAAAIKQLEG